MGEKKFTAAVPRSGKEKKCFDACSREKGKSVAVEWEEEIQSALRSGSIRKRRGRRYATTTKEESLLHGDRRGPTTTVRFAHLHSIIGKKKVRPSPKEGGYHRESRKKTLYYSKGCSPPLSPGKGRE